MLNLFWVVCLVRTGVGFAFWAKVNSWAWKILKRTGFFRFCLDLNFCQSLLGEKYGKLGHPTQIKVEGLQNFKNNENEFKQNGQKYVKITDEMFSESFVK